MKTTFLNGSLAAMAAAATLFSSCSKDTDLYNPALNPSTSEIYSASWTNTFGVTDPNQDWNMATQVSMANPVTGAGVKSIYVYDAMPGTKGAHLLGVFKQSDETLKFDCVKGTESVFIVATDAKDNLVESNYYDIKTTRAAGAVTRANETPGLYDNYGNIGSFTDVTGRWGGGQKKFNDIFTVYRPQYDNGTIDKLQSSSFRISDIVGIVGHDGVFAEDRIENGKCNKLRWKEQLHPEEGVEYVTEGGTVDISVVYGGAERWNQFGYYYYKEGATEEEILRAPRYMLVEYANPMHNVKVDGHDFDYYSPGDRDLGYYKGLLLPKKFVAEYESNGTDATVTGTKYRLAYFGENGTDSQGSYTFPADIHIGFFVVIGDYFQILGSDRMGPQIRYSNPMMNKYFNHTYQGEHGCTMGENGVATDFVTYKWGKQIILGVEDEGGDDDMNDILFFVNGKFKGDEIIDISPEKPKPNSWIVACEDLGDTDDYDFNDVVYSVSHVAGETEAIVTPLAAGGVYETHILYNTDDLGETHRLLGGNAGENGQYPMLNTNSITNTAAPIKVNVGQNFSMANGMGGFGISVVGRETTVLVTAPKDGKAPQMMCLPGTWKWPKERVKIQDAYPKFGEWNDNANMFGWCDSPVENNVLN